jgi:hypothetical protein
MNSVDLGVVEINYGPMIGWPKTTNPDCFDQHVNELDYESLFYLSPGNDDYLVPFSLSCDSCNSSVPFSPSIPCTCLFFSRTLFDNEKCTLT